MFQGCSILIKSYKAGKLFYQFNFIGLLGRRANFFAFFVCYQSMDLLGILCGVI